MICPTEDCLGVFHSPYGICPRCEHQLTPQQREQFHAETNNATTRPIMNLRIEAKEWGGCDYPTDSRY